MKQCTAVQILVLTRVHRVHHYTIAGLTIASAMTVCWPSRRCHQRQRRYGGAVTPFRRMKMASNVGAINEEDAEEEEEN